MGIRSLILLLLFPFFAIAQTNESSTELITEIEPLTEGDFFAGQMAPFVGIGLGYMDENHNLRTEGAPFNIKLIGSFFPTQDLLFDIGVGAISQTFNNQSEKDTVFSGIVDSSLRYRLPQNWQVGPQLKTYVMNGDEFGSSSDVLTTFVGAQVMKEQMLFGKFRNRLGLSLTTDIGIPNETAFVTSIEAQFALGGNPSSATGYVEAEEPELEVPVTRTPVVSSGEVFFELNQSHLKNAADLRAFQTQNPEKLKYVEIVGYADSTGPTGLNLKISRDRARSVQQALIRAGVPEEKIVVRWVGEAEAPKDQLDSPALRKVDVKVVE